MAELQDEFVANRKKGLKRRFWIRRNVELRQYGLTDGCPGCEAAEKRAKAVGNTEVCRQRVQAMLAQETGAAKQLPKRSRKVVKSTEASPASSEHHASGGKRDR